MTTTAIPVWGVTLDPSSTDEGVAVILTSSVQPPPFAISVTPYVTVPFVSFQATLTHFVGNQGAERYHLDCRGYQNNDDYTRPRGMGLDDVHPPARDKDSGGHHHHHRWKDAAIHTDDSDTQPAPYNETGPRL